MSLSKTISAIVILAIITVIVYKVIDIYNNSSTKAYNNCHKEIADNYPGITDSWGPVQDNLMNECMQKARFYKVTVSDGTYYYEKR